MSYLDIELEGTSLDNNDKTYKLSDFHGKNIILYFYPKDNTSGCTSEANSFNEISLPENTVVIGVSPDSIKSHKKFAEKYGLKFLLLSDPEHKLADAFSVWGEKSMYGRKYFGIIRSTFILDKKGNITKEWRKVKVNGHAAEVASHIK